MRKNNHSGNVLVVHVNQELKSVEDGLGNKYKKFGKAMTICRNPKGSTMPTISVTFNKIKPPISSDKQSPDEP